MSKFSQGSYLVKNTEKYQGVGLPTYRSSWELKFMELCDNNPSITMWASESIRIPYRHPFTGKMTNYVPDFLVQYTNAAGEQKVELVEIKPASQTTLEGAKNRRDQTAVHINAAKWQAATEFCKQRGIFFRVINEDSIFQTKKKRIAKPRIPKRKR